MAPRRGARDVKEFEFPLTGKEKEFVAAYSE
jgi:hypothetical protein